MTKIHALILGLALLALPTLRAEAATRYVGGCGAPATATVAAAIAAASSGDTILICPGTYNESVSANKPNLTLRSSTGNRTDVTLTHSGIPLAIDAANLTIKDMTVKSTSSHAIVGNWGGNGSHAFENLAITAKDRGLYITNSGANSFRNLDVRSSANSAIHMDWNADGAHSFDTVTATATGSGYGIYAARGAGSFKGATATGGGDAICIGNKYALTFDDVRATSTGGRGIFVTEVDGGANHAVTFSNVTASAKGEGIRIDRSGKVTMSNVTAASSNDSAVHMKWNADGIHTFDTVEATGKTRGIYVDQGAGSFRNVTVNSGGEAIRTGNKYPLTFDTVNVTSLNDRGIFIASMAGVNNTAAFNNVVVSAKDEGIRIERSGKVAMSTVTAASSNNHAIYLNWDADGAHSFDTVRATAAAGGILAKQGAGSFRNVTLNSGGDAIYTGNKYALSFDTVTATSSNGRGIYVDEAAGASNTVTFNNITVSAKNQGIQINRSGQITMNKTDVTSRLDDGIYVNWNANGAHVFSNITINALKGRGLYIHRGFKSLEDFTISAKGHGIYSDSQQDSTIRRGAVTSSNDAAIRRKYDQPTAFMLEDVVINARNEGVYIERSSSVTIQRVCVQSATDGIKTDWNAEAVTIRDSKFEGYSGFGVNIRSNTSKKATVGNNAFLKSSSPRAYSISTVHKFDGNYWQGVAGGTVYADGNVRDNATLSSNPVTRCYSPGGGGGAPPAGFNCVEAGGDAGTGRLFSKLAGAGFSFDVVALKTGGGVETTYASSADKTVAVELVDGSGSTACASRAALSPPASQNVTFRKADQPTEQGRKAVSMTLAGAYADLRCRVTDASQSPSVVGCSTDNFALRPSGFAISSSASADASGISASAVPAVKAGANFTLTAASGAAGYNGTPRLDFSKVEAHAGAVRTGVLAGGFGGADDSGTAAGTFTYSEVGYFRLAANAVYDDGVTAVDSAAGDCSADFSNTPVGGKYGCKFGNTAATSYFGRIIPDHLLVTPGYLIDRTDINTSGFEACASPFTYMGEDFQTIFTLTAQNSANATTQNYTAGHALFGLSAWSNFAFTGSAGTLAQGASAPAGDWRNGVAANITATHKVTLPASSTAPYTGFIVRAAPAYADGGQSVAAPSTSVSGATEMRHGRLHLSSASGSELLDLPVPFDAQYWTGSQYATNSDDNCTIVPSASVVLSNYRKNLNAGETSVSISGALNMGRSNLQLTKPGAGNSGSVDVSVDTTAAGSPAFGANPAGLATFGVYGSGRSPVIYWREQY